MHFIFCVVLCLNLFLNYFRLSSEVLMGEVLETVAIAIEQKMILLNK